MTTDGPHARHDPSLARLAWEDFDLSLESPQAWSSQPPMILTGEVLQCTAGELSAEELEQLGRLGLSLPEPLEGWEAIQGLGRIEGRLALGQSPVLAHRALQEQVGPQAWLLTPEESRPHALSSREQLLLRLVVRSRLRLHLGQLRSLLTIVRTWNRTYAWRGEHGLARLLAPLVISGPAEEQLAAARMSELLELRCLNAVYLPSPDSEPIIMQLAERTAGRRLEEDEREFTLPDPGGVPTVLRTSQAGVAILMNGQRQPMLAAAQPGLHGRLAVRQGAGDEQLSRIDLNNPLGELNAGLPHLSDAAGDGAGGEP